MEKTKEVLRIISKIINAYSQVFHNLQPSQILAQHDKEELINRKSGLHITTSGIVVNSFSRGYKAAFIYHPLLQKPLFPGGHFELKDIYPHKTAEREIEEETSITNPILHPWHIEKNYIPLQIHIHPIPANPKRNEPDHLHMDFKYLFLIHSPTPLTPRSDGISRCWWNPIQKVKEIYGPLLYERIKNILLSK